MRLELVERHVTRLAIVEMIVDQDDVGRIPRRE